MQVDETQKKEKKKEKKEEEKTGLLYKTKLFIYL